MRNFVHASEAVTPGHPDKLCDQISDTVIDACLSADPPIGCIAECALASGIAFLSIRHGRPLPFDPAAMARRVMAESGYPDMAEADRATVMLDLVTMPELQAAVADPGAVPGLMTTAFGYAAADEPAMMPLPVVAAHRIAARLDAMHGEAIDWLSPDAQVQVAVRYAERRPTGIEGIAMTYHACAAPPSAETVAAVLGERVIAPALAGLPFAEEAEDGVSAFRASGMGGPRTHSGLTGRKTADDGYGGFARQGTSALSGKDPSRIDRVAAYAARQAAVSIVEAGIARECEVQLSYGVSEGAPVSLEVDSFGSGDRPDGEISTLLRRSIDLRHGAVVERLGLWTLPARRGGRFYRDLATLGQVGRPELDLPWDRPLPLS